MSDSALLGLFLYKRDVYDKYSNTVPQHLLEAETATLMQDVGEWYTTHGDPIVPKDIDRFWEFLKLVRHAGMTQEKLAVLKNILKRAVRAGTSADAALILRSLVLRDHAGRIATKADRYSAGDTSFPFFEELLDDTEAAQREAGIHRQHSQEVSMDLTRIMNNLTNLSTGLSWRNPQLQDAMGAIRQGNFVMIAGFVDSGKSTLLASEVTYMASQLGTGEKVLYFNNEEQGDRVAARLVQAAIGWSLDEIDLDKAGALQRYTAEMGGDPHKIIVIDSEHGPITPGLIRKKLREYKVGLMVFDQLYKIRGFRRYGDDKLGQLQDIFEYGRDLAKQNCPVIAIHQARGDAHGEQRIEMHQLAGSQQALQGELDAIVTIGYDPKTPAIRYLYIPKNKLPTPGDPLLRKGFFTVAPDFNIARF